MPIRADITTKPGPIRGTYLELSPVRLVIIYADTFILCMKQHAEL